MQISDLTNQYMNATASGESINGTRGVEQLVSSVRQLAVGNIFEGTINMMKGGQIILGLANGNELSARLEADMQLVPGQSMFFQVKSNDGATIAIRPYTVDGAGANLTLLSALKAANLPVEEKYLNMTNKMMHEQMPIDKNSMGQMARLLMTHPDVDVSTLVQMKKFNIPITTEMVAQFENYIDDKSAIHKALDTFVDQLPAALAQNNMSIEQMKSFDSQLLLILAGDTEVSAKSTQSTAGQNVSVPEAAVTQENIQVSLNSSADATEVSIPAQNVSINQTTSQVLAPEQLLTPEQLSTPEQSLTQEQVLTPEQPLTQEQVLTPEQSLTLEQTLTQEQSLASEQVQGAEQNAATTQKISQELHAFIKDVFSELDITKDDTARTVLHKLAHHIATAQNITSAELEQLFTAKPMKELLKQIIEEQFYLNPKDVADADKMKKLYDKLDGKAQAIENLLQNAGLKDTPLAQTLGEFRANVDFMQQLNQAYTFTQVPLRMTNQNASGQLYVYTSKKNLEDPERDLTAFLHLDLEHLGGTDVSVRMHKKEVSTKFYMDNDASYELVKQFMPQLEERLRKKGYNCKIEVENGGRHMHFVDDFLKKDAPSTAMLHRYSFDVRA